LLNVKLVGASHTQYALNGYYSKFTNLISTCFIFCIFLKIAFSCILPTNIKRIRIISGYHPPYTCSEIFFYLTCDRSSIVGHSGRGVLKPISDSKKKCLLLNYEDKTSPTYCSKLFYRHQSGEIFFVRAAKLASTLTWKGGVTVGEGRGGTNYRDPNPLSAALNESNVHIIHYVLRNLHVRC
jgi:hypothetical protein